MSTTLGPLTPGTYVLEANREMTERECAEVLLYWEATAPKDCKVMLVGPGLRLARTAPRLWAHRRGDILQAVDVLGWTQHYAIVIATEEGWLSMTEPMTVSIGQMELVS